MSIRNYISITVHDDAATNTLMFLTGIFSDNTFVSDGNNLLSPLQTKRTYASISFKNCVIGIVGGTNNIFNRTGPGIKAEKSLVILSGNTYKNMLPGGGAEGYGVFAKESSLLAQKVNFENVWSMVSSNTAKALTVDQCTLNLGLRQGIEAFNNNTFKPIVNITKNVLEFQEVPSYAIRVVRSPGFDITKIQNLVEDNRITVTGGGQAGTSKLIDITAPNGGTDIFPIRRCTLTIEPSTLLSNTSACHGIHVSYQTASGYEVDRNRLFYNATTPPTGDSPNLGISFVLVNGQRNKITANEVNATLFGSPSQEEGASWMKCAYHLDQSPNLDVCENTGNNTYRLFHLSGNLNYCDFAKNSMRTHYYGVLCKKDGGSYNTFMGQQKWHENTWLSAGSYEKYSAYHQDFPNGVDISTNLFRVLPNVPEHMPPGANLNPPKVKPANWFVALPTNPPNDVENSDCIEGNALEPEPRLGGWDDKVMDNTYPFESAAQTWDMQRELNYKLLEYPEERPTSSAAQVWYDAQVNSSPWQFARFEQLYFNAFKIPIADQNTLDSARNKLKVKFTEFAYLDSLQNAAPSEDSIIRQQQSDKAIELVAAQNDFVTLAQQANNTVQTALGAAATQYNNLPTAQVWETSRKTLYGFWLKQAVGQDLTETDLNTARNISNLCPLEAGLAVREMPLILPIPEAYEYAREDYWENCVDSVQERSEIYRVAPIANALSIYPNPAQNQFTLFLTKPMAADWSLIDLSGRTWRNGKFSDKQNSVVVNTESLPAGVYFCTVRTQDGTLLTHKVVIQH